MKKALLLVAILLAITSFFYLKETAIEALPPAEMQTQRALEQGSIIGFARGKSHGWRGIPYAAAPVADLRWKAPRPAPQWSDVRQALAPSPACPQIGGELGGVDRSQFNQVIGQEDCLYLDVWAPAFTPDKVPGGEQALPVMVWIHGGGNSVGRGSEYAGAKLSDEHDVIVVSINYRLGVLGWFSHPSMRQGSELALDNTANFAMLDMIAALQWVQKNIAQFGGDAKNVTIFGESAGGHNVFSLLASPLAEGLFHRAISQSGRAAGMSVELAEAALSENGAGHGYSSNSLLAEWSKKLGEQNILAADHKAQAAWLRSLDIETMLADFAGPPAGMYHAPQLILDGVTLPQRSLLAHYADPATAPKVPVILGTNRDEGRLFMLRDSKFVDANLGVFYRAKNPESYKRLSEYTSRLWKLVGSDAPARAIASSEAHPVWTYRFDWDESSDSIFADLPLLLGAAHGLEIPFVFGDLSFPLPGIFTDDNLVAAETLSAAMRSYWTEFAYRGDPGRGRNGDLPLWSSWKQGEQFMVMDTEADGGLRLSDQVERAEALQTQLLADAQFTNPKYACELYARNFVYTPWWRDEQYQQIAAGACRGTHPDSFFLKRF